jgi:hypothetical protein
VQAGMSISGTQASGFEPSSGGKPEEVDGRILSGDLPTSPAPPSPQPAESISAHTYNSLSSEERTQNAHFASHAPDDANDKVFRTGVDTSGILASHQSTLESEPRDRSWDGAAFDLTTHPIEAPSWISDRDTKGNDVAALPQSQLEACQVTSTAETQPSTEIGGEVENELKGCAGTGDADRMEMEANQTAGAYPTCKNNGCVLRRTTLKIGVLPYSRHWAQHTCVPACRELCCVSAIVHVVEHTNDDGCSPSCILGK